MEKKADSERSLFVLEFRIMEWRNACPSPEKHV